MKRFSLIIAAFLTVAIASAQNINPVSWSFTSKKLGDKEYEIQMLATIQQGWHLYSQSQPEDAIAQPTSFQFNKNPLLDMNGKVKEVGKLEKFKDKTLDVSANQYSNKVLFVQKVKIKGKAKTNVTGKLEFQTCNDEKCLPPKSVNFSIALK
jgi:thiol:disulfide interchange protein DsbD